MKDLVLVGVQGSGKGTQAKFLTQWMGFQIFEMGGALRKVAKENSDLGRQVKEIINRGDLVPTEIVMKIVTDFIENKADHSKPIIWDGIPRSEDQREIFRETLNQENRDFWVIHLMISDELALERLLKRAEIENRSDDKPKVIQKRIAAFHRHTKPLLEKWKEEDRLIEINGEGSPEEVDHRIREALNR